MTSAYPGAVPLRDFPCDLVHIDCSRCPRRGRYRLAGLIRRFGPAASVPEVLAALSADCERRLDWRTTGPCGAGFPALVEQLRKDR